jgi:hypothetical protein
MLPIAAVLFASFLSEPAAAIDARTFEAARKAARANAKTAAGKQYQPSFARAFSESQARELGRCVEAQATPDLSPFEALVEIGSTGGVEEVFVRPASNVALCLRDSIQKARFPRPPRGHYWTSTTLRLKQ